MIEGIFQISTALDGKTRRDHPYVDSFDAHGETWVTHRRLGGVSFGVSHKASGYAVPGVEGVDPQDAQTKALAVLDAKAAQIPGVIAKVMA